MNSSALLLTLLCAVGQAPDFTWQLGPQFVPGLELVYAGTIAEENNSANVHFQRTYRLESTLFVLDKKSPTSDVALMTILQPQSAGAKTAPHHVRLEVGTVDVQGQLTLPKKGRTPPPLEGPALLETGFLVEVPLGKVGKNSMWEVAEADRPPRGLRIVGTEACGGLNCIKIQSLQQSEDWAKSRADRTAWRRQDTFWVSPTLGVAYRVERLVERRDPVREQPTYRCLTQYELSNHPLRYPGKFFEDRQVEILLAHKFQEDAIPLLAQPVDHQRQIDALLKKVSYHVENQPPTPFRKAIVHLGSRIEAIRKGEMPPEEMTGEKAPLPTRVGPGQKIPDLLVTDVTSKTSLRFSKLLGRPVLVFFYQPHTESGKQIIEFARHLNEKYPDKVHLLAMAVGVDPEKIRNHHAQAKLPFPVHDGNALHVIFGVDATPRLVIVDRLGTMRGGFTGWGHHSANEIEQELRR